MKVFKLVNKSMKIFPLSDLHLEFYVSANALYEKLAPKLPDADVLILAGDIGYPVESKLINGLGDRERNHRQNYIDLLKLFKLKYSHVLLVPGNHEYYPSIAYDRRTVFQSLRSICQETQVTLLEKQSVQIDHVKFFGTTLWSAIDAYSVKRLNDFNYCFFKTLPNLLHFKIVPNMCLHKLFMCACCRWKLGSVNFKLT